MHEGNFVKMWLGFFRLWFFIFHCHHKNDLTIENARIKHVLKDGYQESIISKIFKRITLTHNNKHVSKITISAGIIRKMLIGKAGSFLEKSRKLYTLWKILTILMKFPTCFLKNGFLIYGSSYGNSSLLYL